MDDVAIPRVNIKIDADGQTPRADPSRINTGTGRRVEFYNATSGEVTIVVVKHPQANVTLDPQQVGTLNFTNAADGEYVYAAYCKQVDDFAKGSSPRITIP